VPGAVVLLESLEVPQDPQGLAVPAGHAERDGDERGVPGPDVPPGRVPPGDGGPVVQHEEVEVEQGPAGHVLEPGPGPRQVAAGQPLPAGGDQPRVGDGGPIERAVDAGQDAGPGHVAGRGVDRDDDGAAVRAGGDALGVRRHRDAAASR
jgi:hypothetical protein